MTDERDEQGADHPRRPGDSAAARHGALSAGGDAAGRSVAPASVRLVEEALQGGRIVGRGHAARPGRGRSARPGASRDRHRDPHSQGHEAARRHAAPGGAGAIALPHHRRRSGGAVPPRTHRASGRRGAPVDDVEVEALARTASALFQKVVSLSPTLPDELASILGAAESAGRARGPHRRVAPDLADGPAPGAAGDGRRAPSVCSGWWRP